MQAIYAVVFAAVMFASNASAQTAVNDNSLANITRLLKLEDISSSESVADALGVRWVVLPGSDPRFVVVLKPEIMPQYFQHADGLTYTTSMDCSQPKIYLDMWFDGSERKYLEHLAQLEAVAGPANACRPILSASDEDLVT